MKRSRITKAEARRRKGVFTDRPYKVLGTVGGMLEVEFRHTTRNETPKLMVSGSETSEAYSLVDAANLASDAEDFIRAMYERVEDKDGGNLTPFEREFKRRADKLFDKWGL